MNTALIFAGGAGKRMNNKAKPKQFLELNGKAIIIYTLEYFEVNEEIDNIVVVCIDGWIDYLKELIKRDFITKVNWIVSGGATGQESIYNGLKTIYAECDNPKDSIVLIHDGVRPLINQNLITENIACVKKYGSAITVVPQTETVVSINDKNVITSIGDRSISRIARAPQSFILEDIIGAHNQALKENRLDMIDSASLMMHYGHTLHTVNGPMENIKITTPFDFYVFRAIFQERENSQIYGT
ncbi:2-C-methyl-D-erythritol 4-phosphate cytidylyltransferase [Clostridium sp. YIM B02515]|uniref:Ribitol-5-phosphate cytidylyltransferase n=1 Tax=Clostridium rhizosphaerae TaxID=2803861 RepID=A0ABS1T6M9_9CLOT|nr:IspD/TarI family cytidylyltransferase [Clostridium rhizosphaerae]MBL4934998.1 2-C-methyl-D-erythritol 4-phosphate cytidylyltransferase [Clostridium rhizosphaerae]